MLTFRAPTITATALALLAFLQIVEGALVYPVVKFAGTPTAIAADGKCVDLTVIANGLNNTGGIGSIIIEDGVVSCTFYEVCDCYGAPYGRLWNFTKSTAHVNLPTISIDSIECRVE